MDALLIEFFSSANDLFVSFAAELPVSDSVALVPGRFPFPLQPTPFPLCTDGFVVQPPAVTSCSSEFGSFSQRTVALEDVSNGGLELIGETID